MIRAPDKGGKHVLTNIVGKASAAREPSVKGNYFLRETIIGGTIDKGA